ncbi:MAG: hypothetical protein JWM35_2093 [Verrucomicrobia bacterium]|nr:hypothetical protein [Verrucomicrobiota bacterium]
MPWLIAVATFGILALELALIRWTSSQIRVFAYFNNVVLICAFFGMGLGVALGRRWPGLVHGALPALLVLAVPLAFSEQCHLVHLRFPDRSIMLWGGEQMAANGWLFARNLAGFLGLLALIVLVFLCGGSPLGVLFARAPALRAYPADLLGSLAGVIVFTAAAWADTGPAGWLLLGALPFAWLARSWWALGVALAIAALGAFSSRGAIYSPYNRITVLAQPDGAYELHVNRDFHQYMADLSTARLSRPAVDAAQRDSLRDLQALYDLPFVINVQRDRALVVGAGTGNDVQAAVRNGYRHVTSVDIDARILALGQELHPEHPYSAPGVTRVVDDARSFFGKHRDEKFDVVCFGLLDSHAMSSAMSTLRLDNYVYTEQGIRAAWERVAPGGHLSLAISVVGGQWFFDRLYWTITRATGREPMAFYSPQHGNTASYIVPKPGAGLVTAELARRVRLFPAQAREQVASTSDDWPFLYLRPDVIPWGYLIVLGSVLALAAVSSRAVFGLRGGGAGFHGPLFLMGAAFLLIETRGVTSLSLLFGSTWLVNSVVFAGILVMVLAAALAVARWGWRNPATWFPPLFAAVALQYFFPLEWLHALPLAGRAVAGGLLIGLPVGLAGIIVPMLLARAADPAAALGANLLGAVLGGCLEYFSMLGGLRSLALMALVLYLLAYLGVRKSWQG